MCPSSATITAYYTFVQKTKAKASEVNYNFQNHRGHLLPINTDTITASNNTHDLGAPDHTWRTIYLATVTASSFLGGPGSGSGDIPAFRALVPNDMPPVIKMFMFNQFS